MAALKLHRETTLPGTLEANSIYFIKPSGEDDYVEIYVTGTSGAVVRRVLKESDVQAMIDASLSSMTEIQIVADITARDALDFDFNFLVIVQDASADGTVASGAALYVWDETGQSFTKLSEYESMDVTIGWADVANKPSSAVGAIDDAVSKKHSHDNKTQIDKIDEDGNGDMTYDGQLPATGWASTGW